MLNRPSFLIGLIETSIQIRPNQTCKNMPKMKNMKKYEKLLFFENLLFFY